MGWGGWHSALWISRFGVQDNPPTLPYAIHYFSYVVHTYRRKPFGPRTSQFPAMGDAIVKLDANWQVATDLRDPRPDGGMT